MKNNPHTSRSSGILAHVSSLPSPFGIGDLGSGTEKFLDFLAESGQSIWQILPLGPTDSAFSNSPYMTISAFAGNPLLISPDELLKDGLLRQEDLAQYPVLSPYNVNFEQVTEQKTALLNLAFSRFTPCSDSSFNEFVEENRNWLSDYCLFRALKTIYPDLPWYQWNQDLAQRKEHTLSQVANQLQEEISYFQFEQYIFWRQWKKIHNLAKKLNIKIFGDIPIYVSLDSADVWANQDIFQLDSKSRFPIDVAGVPPDYFSDTGQKWGNPLYRWNTRNPTVKDKLYQWWRQRFQTVFTQVDIARIDHFRGFQAYWAVPASHTTAMKGKWKSGPGADFFRYIFKELGPLEIIAEDLGEITEDVIELREELNFPGMRVLQFAFDGNRENTFLPFNFETSNTFVYTGTHDNNTTVGWFLSERLDDNIRRQVKQIANRDLQDGHGIHRDLIFLAMSSTAVASIYPLQDILGFGGDCRMNTPGTDKGNWTWRCSQEFLTNEITSWLRGLTELFGRFPKEIIKESTSLTDPL